METNFVFEGAEMRIVLCLHRVYRCLLLKNKDTQFVIANRECIFIATSDISMETHVVVPSAAAKTTKFIVAF